MLRVSTTQLESFRLFLTEDWMDEAELIASIRGVFAPNHAINLGSAFGKVLEDPLPYVADGGYRLTVGGETFEFGADVMAPCLALMDRGGVYEAKATKDYGDVCVVARADQIVGLRLIEHKTTLGSFNFEKYAASYQWRFMADLFGPAIITYHVFCLSEAINSVIGLKGIESFNLFPYPQLQADCRALVREFVQWLETRDLRDVLEARHAAAVA